MSGGSDFAGGGDHAGGDHAGGDGEIAIETGYLDTGIRSEFPGLALRYVAIERGSGRSNRGLKERLRILSNRFAGPQAINMRQQPIPWAYRVFYRHIGLDPDQQRTPIEEIALERMKRGGFKSQNLLDDALTIAIMESGVALRAFDADKAVGRLGIRLSAEGEALEGRPGALPVGTLVIADEMRPLALLFGALGSGRGVNKNSKRMLIASIQVKGVPDIAVEEALWLCAEAINTA